MGHSNPLCHLTLFDTPASLASGRLGLVNRACRGRMKTISTMSSFFGCSRRGVGPGAHAPISSVLGILLDPERPGAVWGQNGGSAMAEPHVNGQNQNGCENREKPEQEEYTARPLLILC